MSDHSLSEPDPRALRRAREREALLRRKTINRHNAQHSTGPRSAAGRAASSRNSFRHGHYSAQTVLNGEPLADYQDLREDLLSQYQPVGHTEAALVEEVAQSRWRVLRFRRHEACIMGESDQVYAQPELLFTINRLMAGAERAFYRALRELERLQTLRAVEERSDSQAIENELTYQENGFVPPNGDSAPSQSVGEPQAVLETEAATETEVEFVLLCARDGIQEPEQPSAHLP